MSGMAIIGLISFVVGILLAIFPRPVGIAFCRLGKWLMRSKPFWINESQAQGFERMRDRVYNERTAPRTMLFLGIVFAVQGVVLCLLDAAIPWERLD